MKITENIDLCCPSGFYCKKGNQKCCRIGTQDGRPYCEVFYPFLETDSKGNVLKVERCLLAERKARCKE